MRIKKCRNCRTTIPAGARKCPYCYKLQWSASMTIIGILFLGIILAGVYITLRDRGLIAFGPFISSEKRDEKLVKEDAQPATGGDEVKMTSEDEAEERLLEIQRKEIESLEEERREQARIEKEQAERATRERERLRQQQLAREKKEKESVKRKIEEREKRLREIAEQERAEKEQQDITSGIDQFPELSDEVEPSAINYEEAMKEGLTEDLMVPVEEVVSEEDQTVEDRATGDTDSQ